MRMSDTFGIPISTADVECWLFLHMFKAGGTAVTDPFHRYFGAEHHGLFNTRPDHPRNPVQMGENLQFASGHGLFGVHRYLARTCMYFTFLREPAKRLFSAFHNIREPSCSKHPWHETFSSMTFLEFLELREHPAWNQIDNYQVRELVGMAGGENFHFNMHNVDLERAKMNITNHFAFVGQADRIDEQVPELGKLMNITLEPTMRLNVTQNKPKRMTSKEKARVIELNTLDYSLISWLKEHRCEF